MQLEMTLDCRRALKGKEREQGYIRLCELLGFKAPLDGFMTALTGEKQLDVVKLDDMLHVEYMSLTDWVRTHYGVEAADLLRGLSE